MQNDQIFNILADNSIVYINSTTILTEYNVFGYTYSQTVCSNGFTQEYHENN
jgi:hypothetical protein